MSQHSIVMVHYRPKTRRTFEQAEKQFEDLKRAFVIDIIGGGGTDTDWHKIYWIENSRAEVICQIIDEMPNMFAELVSVGPLRAAS